MSAILMSIKPEYVEKILSGEKKYEFRKVKAKKDNIDKIVIYATSPIKKVVGEVEVKEIMEEDKNKLWNITKDYSGTNKKSYDLYYKNSIKAIVYKLGKVTIYDKEKTLKDFKIKYAPQSYVYLD